jgi:hypothetical protein
MDIFLNLPSEEEIKRETQKRIEADSANCISKWFPLVKAAELKVPETKIIELGLDLYWEIMNSTEGGSWPGGKTLDDLYQTYKEMSPKLVFMKLGNFSGKHSWNSTCFIPKYSTQTELESHLVEMIYMQLCFGCTESPVVALREYIPTQPAFYSKSFNGMPVTRERRIFTNENCEVVCHHPYWPEAVFQEPLSPEDKSALETINTISKEDEEYLCQEAQKAAKALHPLHSDGWSIDFLQDADGAWWLIDVARSHQSWHWPHNQV